MAKEIELRIDGVAATYRLLEKEAPLTSKALWDILPLEETARHFRFGGHAGFFIQRTLRDLKLPIENRLSFYVPGTLSIKPHQGEVAICYGAAQARTLQGNAGNEWATRFADAVGDPKPFLAAVARTLVDGKKTITITRKGG